jgi:hypothetical protein
VNDAHAPPLDSVAGSTRMNAIDRWFLRVILGLWLVCAIGSLVVVFRFWDSEADAVLERIFFALLLSVVFMLVICVEVGVPLRVIVNLAVPGRRHAYRIETCCLAGVFICLAMFKMENARSRLSLAPPAGVTTLTRFADRMPPPRQLELYLQDGRRYIAWHGERMSLLTFPSGPSCYLFDDRGQLVDWQPETGDGGPVQRFLSDSVQEQAISVDEALALVLSN